MRDALRKRLLAEVQARGVAPVARDLGVPVGSLQSFLLGTEREGTALQIELRDEARCRRLAGKGPEVA